MATDKDVIVDPTPDTFVKQAIIVALVLMVLGLLVFIFASVVAGGVMVLLGIVLGTGSATRI